MNNFEYSSFKVYKFWLYSPIWYKIEMPGSMVYINIHIVINIFDQPFPTSYLDEEFVNSQVS